MCSKTCVKRPLSKRPKIGFQDQLMINAGQKYFRMLLSECSKEHSAILSTFIKLPFVIQIFVLSIFEWPFYTGFCIIFLTFLATFNMIVVCYLICLCTIVAYVANLMNHDQTAHGAVLSWFIQFISLVKTFICASWYLLIARLVNDIFN